MNNFNLEEHQISIDFLFACKENNIELVEYLSCSSTLKEHSNIHIDRDKPLIEACR